MLLPTKLTSQTGWYETLLIAGGITKICTSYATVSELFSAPVAIAQGSDVT